MYDFHSFCSDHNYFKRKSKEEELIDIIITVDKPLNVKVRKNNYLNQKKKILEKTPDSDNVLDFPSLFSNVVVSKVTDDIGFYVSV